VERAGGGGRVGSAAAVAAEGAVGGSVPREHLVAKDPEKALTLAELDEARAQLAHSTGKRRLDVLFDARDPGALIRALPPDELYFTVREVGLSDAVELVQLASAEQFKVILDLDAWRQGRFEPRRALPWLRAARAGALSDPRAAARWERKRKALDPEVLYLLLRDVLIVHDLEDDDDPELTTDRFMRSPEGKFIVEFNVEGAEYSAVRGLIDDLYAENAFLAVRLLSTLRWELPSELEETALRWRTGRLADLGYPSLQEALSWYARPPPGEASAPGSPSRAPGFFLAPLAEGSLLARAAVRLDAEDRAGLELQLVGAGNAVLVADGIDPVDLDQVRDAVAGARAMVELGLAKRSGGDLGRATTALGETPVKRLFQEGFGRVLALSWRAERLFKSEDAGTRANPLLDAPLGEMLTALAARRPRYQPGLEAPRQDWGSPVAAAETRRFLSEADLVRTAAALDLAEGLARLARELGLTPRGGEATARLSTRYLTALANERLGRPFTPAPIPAADLRRAAEAVADPADPRLLAHGEAGALLASLARQQAEALAVDLDAGGGRPGSVQALLMAD